ncbi:MAG: hypothetical protein RL119_215 [Actinomycetota bacterium]
MGSVAFQGGDYRATDANEIVWPIGNTTWPPQQPTPRWTSADLDR